jgi:hypothetical protein
MPPNRRGQRHIDRLISAIYDVLEDPNQAPELRVETMKLLLSALDRRSTRKKKSSEVRAVELMLGTGAPKRQTPFVTNNPFPPKKPKD